MPPAALVVFAAVVLLAVVLLRGRRGTEERYAPPFGPGETMRAHVEVTFGFTRATRKTHLVDFKRAAGYISEFRNMQKLHVNEYNLALLIAGTYLTYSFRPERRHVSYRQWMMGQCAIPSKPSDAKAKRSLDFFNYLCGQMRRGTLGITCRLVHRPNPCYNPQLKRNEDGTWKGGWIC